MNPGDFLRRELALRGIYLDEPRAPAKAAAQASQDPVAPIDRDAIRAVLLERGAPADQLDWLTRSCISMDHALAFEPTPWMRRDTDNLTAPAYEAGEGLP